MIPVLTIASSDSCGGAGIQADLRAFNALGLHGMTVIVTVTAQNSHGVKHISEVPIKNLKYQLAAIFEDSPPFAIKTGMMYSDANIRTISEFLLDKDIPIIVDPVIKSTAGNDLFQGKYIDAIREFASHATILMPNIYEAELISGLKIKTKTDMMNSARKLIKIGCKYVLLKGGHLGNSKSTDILYDGKRFMEFSSPKINTNLHGAGCAFSALITGYIAKGSSVPEAVQNAKKNIYEAIKNSYSVGKGNLSIPSISCLTNVKDHDERIKVTQQLNSAVSMLKGIRFPKSCMPRVGINFVYSTSKAKYLDDVCGVPGRLWLKSGRLNSETSNLEFGASKHVATIVLTAMRWDKTKRSVINIKYSANNVKACEVAGLKIGTFSRKDEPRGAMTMEWGTDSAIRKFGGKVPDIIYDKGSQDKEAMIRVIGNNPGEVVKIIRKITTTIQ